MTMDLPWRELDGLSDQDLQMAHSGDEMQWGVLEFGAFAFVFMIAIVLMLALRGLEASYIRILENAYGEGHQPLLPQDEAKRTSYHTFDVVRLLQNLSIHTC